jgi:SAM-dependent methyltransferase/uncharacterized protein YbaR (Trm112 family)
MPVDPSLLDRLVCPRHGTRLSEAGAMLVCEAGHQYPVIEDVPVLLEEGPQTMQQAERSLRQVVGGADPDRYYLDTVGISDEERAQLRQGLGKSNGIDPVVSYLVSATNGMAYQHLIGNLQEYPIPELRLPPGNGRVLLDIGCSWGRWSMAAARLGYKPIGIDPSLGAVLAARRVAAQLGLKALFLVGDARFLPFGDDSLDVVFSYSVIQHFSREDAGKAIKEIGRVLRMNGRSLIQMPTLLGLRCIYHQARRRFREPHNFDVRYWSIPALRKLFTESVGLTRFAVDCFFGIGLQASDLRLMPATHRAAIHTSELLRKTSRVLPWLCYAADSVYVESTKVKFT